MESVEESTERIMERVRLRNMELCASLDKDKENSDCAVVDLPGKSASNLTHGVDSNADHETKSAMKNRTNENKSEISTSSESTKTSKIRSRFSELAAEYEQFEIDQNWHQTVSKPKESYLKGVSPRLSMGETRSSVLCTPTGLVQLKSPRNTKSPVNRESSQLKADTTADDNGEPKADFSKEENRRIHFADPIADTQILDNDSSICTTATTDENSIVGGFGQRGPVYVLPIPPARTCQNSSDVEINLSNSEYGAHTFIKKVSVENSIRNDGEIDTSCGEYGAHTYVKKKESIATKCHSTSPIAVCSPKPFVRSASQTRFSPVQFIPTKTSSPNCEMRTITMHTKLTTEIPLPQACFFTVESSNDSIDEESKNRALITSAHPVAHKSSLRKHHTGKTEEAYEKKLSPIRSAVVESAKAKKIAQQLEEKLKGIDLKIPTPKPLITAPTTASITPNTPTTGVQTQWRGSCNTPVVVGATPGVPTQPDVRATNLKNLKTRWEFSSMTGTPIHPDETEDDIVKAAIRMRDRSLPFCKATRKPRDPQPYLNKISNSIETPERFPTCSPVSRSSIYTDESHDNEDNVQANGMTSSVYSPYKSPAIKLSPQRLPTITSSNPKQLENTDVDEQANSSVDDRESNYEENNSHSVSHLIDQAFEFMDSTPNKYATGDTAVVGDCVQKAPLADEERTLLSKQPLDGLPDTSNVNSGDTCNSMETETHNGSHGSLLPYTVSFYRKRLREMRAVETGMEKIDLTSELAATPLKNAIGSEKHTDIDEGASSKEERLATLERDVSVQQQHIAQATRALRYCKEQTEFRGSREEVDAQRALLIATETRRALLFEIDRLNRGESQFDTGPRGTLAVSNITIFLDRDYVNSQINHTSGRDEIYYFIVLLRHGCDVQHTAMVTSDEGVRRKGILEFNCYMSFEKLTPDFKCILEVFGLRTKREHISHEVKYRLAGTLSKKQRSKFSTISKTSIGGPSALIDPAFQLVGKLTIDISTQGRRMMLQDVLLPLDGSVIVKIKKQAIDKSRTINRGFLSMYQRTSDGLGNWTRYWCVLENGEMKFWRNPDEERDGKQWLVLLDLQTCAGDGASTVRDVCPYPNSFHIDVWVPKENPVEQGSRKREFEKLRVMLAADTKAHLNSWLEVINTTARHLLMWDGTAGMYK